MVTLDKNESGQNEIQVLHQIVQWSGLDLPLDRAAALLPGLQEILEADGRIAQLDLGILTIVGLPWSSEVRPRDQR